MNKFIAAAFIILAISVSIQNYRISKIQDTHIEYGEIMNFFLDVLEQHEARIGIQKERADEIEAFVGLKRGNK